MPRKKNSSPSDRAQIKDIEKRGFIISLSLHALVVLLALVAFIWPKPKRDFVLVELLPLGQIVQGNEAQQPDATKNEQPAISQQIAENNQDEHHTLIPEDASVQQPEDSAKSATDTAIALVTQTPTPRTTPSPTPAATPRAITATRAPKPSPTKSPPHHSPRPTAPAATSSPPPKTNASKPQPTPALTTPPTTPRTPVPSPPRPKTPAPPTPRPTATPSATRKPEVTRPGTPPPAQQRNTTSTTRPDPATASATPRPTSAAPHTKPLSDRSSDEATNSQSRQAVTQAIRDRLARRVGRMGVSGANEQGISGTRNPASLAPAVAAFYSHVRDVYYRAWRQPVTQNTGHTAVLKIRLDREGNILNSVLVSPSGNAAMDESVRAAARAVTRLGRSLPDELAGETVEVSITFEY